MGCIVYKTYKTSKANTKSYLEAAGVIDKYNNIISEAKYNEYVPLFNKKAREQYPFIKEDILLRNDVYGDTDNLVFNTGLFHKIDYSKGIIYKDNNYLKGQSFYQLHSDPERKKIDYKLEEFIKSMLSKLGVTIKDFESFRSAYKQRTGKEISMVSVADLFENIIYVANDRKDGTTLSEEAFHFIVDIFWDNPLIKEIREYSFDGKKPDFKKTDIYAENYLVYEKAYEGDQDKIDKEIIGKLLARTIYDQYYTETKTYRILKQLERILRRALGKLFRNIRLTREITPNGISEGLQNILSNKVTAVREESFQAGLNTRTATIGKVEVPSSGFSEKAARELVMHLRARKRTLEEKVIGLYNEILKNRFEDLKAILGNESFANLKTRLAELAAKPSLTLVEEQELKDIKDYFKLIKLDKIDESNLDQVAALEKRILFVEANIAAQNFEAGIFTFFFGPDGNGENGAVSDIDAILKAVLKIEGKIATDEPIVFDLETYGRLAQALDLYSPIITTLKEIFQEGFTFTELSDINNKLLADTINTLANDKLNYIERFLKSKTTAQIKDLFREYKDINPNLESRLSPDVVKLYKQGLVSWLVGSAQNAKEDVLGIFNKKIVDSLNKIHAKTDSEATELWAKLQENLKGKQLDGNKLVEYLDGKMTGYFLNPYSVQKWENERKKAYDKIFEELEEYSTSQGFNLTIPRDHFKRDQFFSSVMFSDPKTLSPTNAHIHKLYALYNKKWANWYNKNTMAHPRAKEIIEQRQKSMNKTQFARWKKQNIRTSFIYGEEPTTYYTGELSVPSDGRAVNTPNGVIKTNNYTNPDFEKLKKEDPETFAALILLTAHHFKSFEGLPVPSSYEMRVRLPQITQSNKDLLFKGFSHLTEIGDKITDIYTEKSDDPLFAERDEMFGTGEILDRPQVRYVHKLPHPETISKDLFRTTVLFREMSNSYNEFLSILPDLNGIMEVTKRAPRESSSQNIFTRNIDALKEDYLEKTMQQLIDVHIKGEQFSRNGSLSGLTKLLSSLRSYIVGLRLRGNIPSMVVGYVSGQVESGIETFLGTHINKEDKKFGIVTVAKQSAELLKDFEKPNKTAKLSVIAQNMGLIDSIEDKVSNTNTNRITRAAAKVLDWGGWRFADVLLKYEAMVGVAHNMRIIDGKVYTKKKWKGNPDIYNSAPTLYDAIEVVDGKMKIKSEFEKALTEDVLNIFKNKVKVLASRLDSQPLNIDKGAIYYNRISQFATVNSGWLFQMINRSTKSSHFNYLTSEEEVGWWTTFIQKGLYNPANIFRLKHIYDNGTAAEQEAIKRLVLMMVATSMTFTSAYILSAMLLGTDDEEEESYDNPKLTYITHIAVRALMEQEARVTLSDFIRYLVSPASGVEHIDDYFSLLILPFRLMGSSGEVEGGFYKGYDKNTKAIIKQIPLVKQLFETAYGGYINEMTGKGATSIEKSIKDRNAFITNVIVNKGEWYDVTSLPFGQITKAPAKYIIARPIADMVSEYPESKSMIALPDKKSNKEED